MPLPLAPLLPLVLRLGVIASASYAASRWVRARTFTGRTDQRAEDAFDDLGEGLSLHNPADRAVGRTAGSTADSQTNASARLRREIRFRGKIWELDASAMARFRLRTKDQ